MSQSHTRTIQAWASSVYLKLCLLVVKDKCTQIRYDKPFLQAIYGQAFTSIEKISITETIKMSIEIARNKNHTQQNTMPGKTE